MLINCPEKYGKNQFVFLQNAEENDLLGTFNTVTDNTYPAWLQNTQ